MWLYVNHYWFVKEIGLKDSKNAHKEIYEHFYYPLLILLSGIFFAFIFRIAIKIIYTVTNRVKLQKANYILKN